MPKILIVDDEWLTRLEIEEMLTDLGYDVSGQAETGAEAVAMARELNPDLILMDVEMPGEMNGIDAARVIKAELGTPIVFVSGHDDPEHIEAAKEIAVFGYVMKPFDEREVHAFVEIALSRRKLELKLEEAHDELERRVESRTAELEEANKQLQEENEAHKRTEEALRESEEHLRSFMESAKGFVVYRLKIDPKDYHKAHVAFVSPSLKDIIGVSPQEQFSEWFKNIHEDDLPSLINAQNESAQSGVPLDQEFRLKSLEGEWRWFHVISNPVFDSEGKPEYYNGITIDITEQKQATQALREKERFREGLLNDMITFVAVLDPSGNVIFVNNTPLTVGGIKLEDIRGKKFFDAFWWTHSDEVREMIKRDIEQCASGESIVHDVPIQTADGSLMWIEFSMHPIHDEYGVVQYLIPEGRDITTKKLAEETLRKSEEKFRTLFDTSPHAIALTEMKTGKIVDVNDKFCQLTEYKKDEVIGVPTTQLGFYSEDDRNRFVDELTDSGKVHGLEMDFRAKHGSIINAHMFAVPIQFEGEALVLTEFYDVTEQKRTKEALLVSEEKFRSLFEESRDAIVLTTQQGRFSDVNPAALELFGYTKEEISKMYFQKLYVDPNGGYKFQEEMKGKGSIQGFETKLRGKSDVEMDCVLDVVCRRRDDGSILGYQGIIRDISEAKRGQDALRESEDKYRTLVEESFDGIFVQRGPSIIFVNKRLKEMLGYGEGELIGQNHWVIYHPDYQKLTRERAQSRMRGEEVLHRYEVKLLRKDGSWFYGEINAREITFPSDKESGIQVWIKDIMEQKLVEEERIKLESQLQHAQKMEAIGTLAGGVAHDLNNILGGLVSYPELLLLQLPPNSPLRKSILTIQKSGEKAAAVVQDLLTLARRGVVVTEVVSLNKVIAEYLKSPELETLQSYHPGVHVETHLEKNVLNILGSSIHLSKTVMNLVSNAAEAMPEGGALTVSTQNRYIDRHIRGYDNVNEGDYVVLTISDTGIGISPEDMGKIFEPFYTKKKMGRSGTGLGMAVVWGTVKDHNGYIDVQSTEGRGTTFTLYFPATREKLSEDKSHLAIGSYSGDGESILVIDDVEEQRKIASGMLKELGYSVVSVSSGEEAIEYLRTNKIDLLVLDMIMDPGMDGLDTYKKIIEIHPGQKAIITSGFSETDRAKELQSLGAGAYIRKPFLLEKIGLAVKEELEKQAVFDLTFLTPGDRIMPRIMIADDDVTIQLELEEYLTHLGHTVVGTVDTGEDAVELAREMKPDLILMDVHLPVEIDGIAAAQKIKEEMDVAVVFVTGFGDPEDIERAKQVEPFGYVIKPFDEREINATIEIALYKKEMELKLRKANDQLNHANRDLKQEIKERKQAEEVLRESEEKYRTILESIEDGYFEVDVSGNFMFFNDSMCEILGYSKDELMGMNNRQYTDEENAKKLYQTFNTVYTTGKSDKGFDWEIIRKDGSKKYIEASVSLRKDSEGHPMGFRGIAREVAARRQAEEGLRESEAKYRRVSDNSPAVLYQFMMTPDGAFSFPYVSDVVEASIGISAEEIMKDSSKFLGMVHPEDQKMFQESIMKSVESLESFPLTFRCMKDGGVIWMEARGTPAPLADGGILWDGFLLDITDRKQAEEALQESEEKYRSMMESMYDPAYICSPDYRIEYMNSVMVKRTGRDAVGEHCYKMIHELDRKCPWCVHDKVQQDENCVIETVSPKDNRTYSVSHSPIKHADGSISKLTVYRDVTELKNMEQHLGQAQKMEAIGTLAGGVAHEFNNTLMGIMGNIELLKMNFSGDGGIDKHLESMKSAGHRMSRLTTQLLAYAEGGKYQPKDLKINDFVIETLPILQHDLNPEVRVETHFPKDISYINADYAQMQMVLSAILANSNEAIEDEGIIRITAENKDLEQDFTKQHPGLKPGSHVCLTIEDDGKGMDEEARNGIFEPFFTTKFQGRGMGMAAAHGIVKNHDGWISVDSELGKGTTVQIYLPAIEVEVEKPKKAKAEGGTGSGTILMIEDKDVVIEVTQAMLEMLGYRVMVAKTGKDAIHIAETFDGQIDLALLDIKLPDMEGGKVYPYIMKARPELKVIVFSGYSIDGPARRILDAGAQDYIQKPFSLAALSEKLKVVLEGK